MTIVTSLRPTVLLRADPPAATEALAQITGRSPQLDQSSSINKVVLDRTYLIMPPRGIKQPIT